jgi:hypothetical protein
VQDTSCLAESVQFEWWMLSVTITTVRQGRGIVACKGCHSDRQSVFNGEIAIHFGGLEGLEQPIVWVFQETVVCLHCGFTEFTVPASADGDW